VLSGDESAFFTNGDDAEVQRTWAREMGMPAKATLTDILLAQIEAHRTEVFYNGDPVRYGSAFVRRLPGCVRKAIAWRNAPSPVKDFSEYDLVLCNSASMLRKYERNGWKAAYFTPAHDSAMDEYAVNDDRPIDVLFIGTYLRHHMRRAAVLEAVSVLRDRYRIEFGLTCSRFTRLAESPAGHLAPLDKYRRPRGIRAVTHDPVFGRDMYALISKSKVVLNASGDMEGEDRGNMRCFESMGCRSLLLSDEGIYPEGMVADETMITYQSTTDAVAKLEELLRAPHRIASIADAGYKMVATQYSKERQWNNFQTLVADH
jgi:hypothetical protein